MPASSTTPAAGLLSAALNRDNVDSKAGCKPLKRKCGSVAQLEASLQVSGPDLTRPEFAWTALLTSCELQALLRAALGLGCVRTLWWTYGRFEWLERSAGWTLHALIASFKGMMPMMFMTRARL
jgi:hypothetical protein